MPGLTRRSSVAEFVSLGDPLFAGDTGPVIALILLQTTGGLVDLSPVGQAQPVVQVNIRRFDARRQMAQGAVVASGIAIPFDQPVKKGWALMDWLQLSPIASVPTETGYYVIQVQVIFPDGHTQTCQRAIFEVLPGFN